MYSNFENHEQIYRNWSKLINAKNDITDDAVKMSTALVLENTQRLVDSQYRIQNSRGILNEQAGLGVSTMGAMGPYSEPGSISNTAGREGDARVPSVVIPMVRRIFPNLIAHKLVGVQPMSGPIGMAFAFRAKYGRNGKGANGADWAGKEIGYVNVNNSFTGRDQVSSKYGIEGISGALSAINDQGRVDLSEEYIPSGVTPIADDEQDKTAAAWKAFYGNDTYMNIQRANGAFVGDGADVAEAENWGIGTDMPEAGFEFIKATVTAKTRKLGVKISREVEEDMKAMQGMNAQNEVSNIISYEISQEIDRQLLAEIVQSAVRCGNTSTWSPALADGRNQRERIDALYTDILQKSAQIAVQTRRGAANWCVASPSAAALLESHIYNPLGVAGGLGNANAFGKSIDGNIGVVEIGALRNGTIKLYRDSLAGGDYILLGYKGSTIYDAGVIYLPYIPLELMHSLDPFTMNPMTAARTRYGVTTNLLGGGQFYHFIALSDLNNTITSAPQFTQP